MSTLGLPLGFENPLYGLLGIALGVVFVLLSSLSYRKLRIAEKRLELAKWKTMRKVVRAANFGMKASVILALSFLLATPYLNATMVVPIDEVTDEQMEQYSATIMILMDVSNSMNTADLKPTRLDVSKSMVQILIQSLDTKDLVGFISFAGEIYDSILPTANRSAVLNLVENQTCHPSTAIGTALEAAIGAVGTYEGGKALVLFSDGRNNWGADLASVVEEISALKIPVFTVFLGTYGIGESDPLSLREISDKTGGKFYEVRNEEMENLAAEVSKISQEVKAGALKSVYNEITVDVKDYEFPTIVLSALLVVALLLAWFTGV